ncbi:DUF1569 domain-containing protein [Streptomyces sp. NPDC004539]|uniref:DUF1569 domain-containing protein n=1 Tax=Streptomyces sp. NPDC004539 TaxID=3154280 RepID=UPI00339FDFEF
MATVSAPTPLAVLVARLHERLGTPEAELHAAGGSFNLSQTLQHCAQTVRYSVTGYPQLKSALFRVTVGALAKRVFLRRGATKHSLDAGLDGAPALDPELPASEAARQFADAVALFGAHTGPHPSHPAYGRCTHDEFERLHAMHLAEHLPGLVAV